MQLYEGCTNKTDDVDARLCFSFDENEIVNFLHVDTHRTHMKPVHYVKVVKKFKIRSPDS